MTPSEDDENRSDVRNLFRWGLQALAMDADTQRSLFPDHVDKPWELVDDYSHWSEVARKLLATEFRPDHLEALDAIDQRMDNVSFGGADFDEQVWTDEALGTHPHWEELRALARVALSRLGWPAEKPPWGRSMYSGP